MKTKVGEYKGKVIVEGGENPKNELRSHEILKENGQTVIQVLYMSLFI